MGEGKRISKKKVSTRTMIKKAVRGGKIDFHLKGKRKLSQTSQKFNAEPRSRAQRIRNPTSNWN